MHAVLDMPDNLRISKCEQKKLWRKVRIYIKNYRQATKVGFYFNIFNNGCIKNLEAQEKYEFSCKYLVLTDCFRAPQQLNIMLTDQNKDQHEEKNKASLFSYFVSQ